MFAQWDDNRCILCTQEPPSSDEHLIPRSIGGKLVANFLCKCCNSKLGHELEAQVRCDPAIRIAVHNLRDQIPEIYKSVLEGADVVVEGPGQKKFPAKFKEGGAIIHPRAGQDGSLIFATDHPSTPKNVEGILSSSGLTGPQIQETMRRIFDSEKNESISVGYVKIEQWDIGKADVTPSGPRLNHAVPAKIAYEYLALHVGTDIYHPAFDSIRSAIREQCVSESMTVTARHTDKYEPYHRIALDNAAGIAVHICLFGWQVYTVEFLNMIYGGICYRYDHALETGEEVVLEIRRGEQSTA